MKILVTGAAGVLGREVAEVFRPDHEVMAVDLADFDILVAQVAEGTSLVAIGDLPAAALRPGP